MDPVANKQELILAERARLTAAYPALWAKIITEWKQPGVEDRAWLVYSANYLFRTGGVRWALDPIRLSQRLPGAPEMDFSRDLDGLSFVLLTHSHKDHFDAGLLHLLRHLPVTWVAPEPLLDLLGEAGIALGKIIVPRPFQTFELKGIRITTFPGQHMVREAGRPGGVRGVPSTGYLAEFNGKRWLIPGDTRNFDPLLAPGFGMVDGAFVHLWMGRGSALERPSPLLEQFCRYCAALQAGRLVVTHLCEYGRDERDFWDMGHYEQARRRLEQIAPTIEVRAARMGENINLE